MQPNAHLSPGQIATIVFLCFVASFLGSWVFLRTGLVRPDSEQVITSNRESIVLQEGEVVAGVAKKASPSVVSITTESIESNSLLRTVSQASGTGIVISRDGYVLTNKHVISGATLASVVLSDGTVYKNVAVIGSDPLNDIAFLKISNVNNLTPAKLGDSSKVTTGQKVVSIGNALGQYQNSVTSGIISGQGRPVFAEDVGTGEQLDNLFQTDAAINQGNSGGPLLNLQGEVIAINTAVALDAEGIGFAIPINGAKGMIKGLLKTGKIGRAFLGVRYVNLTPDIATQIGVGVKRGAYIFDTITDGRSSSIVTGSPADKAGLKEKDIITKVNKNTINENTGLSLLLSEFSPGDTVTITFQRGQEIKTVDVTLGQYQP